MVAFRRLSFAKALSWLPVGMAVNYYFLTVDRLPSCAYKQSTESSDEESEGLPDGLSGRIALTDRLTPTFICHYKVGDVVLYR